MFISAGLAEIWHGLQQGARALAILQAIGETNLKPGFIFQYYTRFGEHSHFRSLRGRQGKRNYFSGENALFIDGVLASIRRWWRAGLLTRDELDFLMTSVIEEVVITANVSGTFHDFNRDRLWPNAMQRFTLRVPISERRDSAATIINADAITSSGSYPLHDVSYLDPPYNFRQYTAYYHFLNFIAAYPHLASIKRYVQGLVHVRGQNMDDDYTSDFSFRDRFIDSLRLLIERVPARHVFLSYYGGRNHWNHWAEVETPGNEGFLRLRELFEDRRLFSRHEVTSALEIRKNFQSRVGEQKSLVNEYLFYGQKRATLPTAKSPAIIPTNENLGIAEAFCPIVRRSLVKEAGDEIGVGA